METSTEKGLKLENQIFDLVSKLLQEDNFIVPKKSSEVFQRKGYYSSKREKEIIFDVTIETTLPGADKYSILTIIECKNLNRKVSVDDIEEFGSKINQIGEHNTKGIVITTHSFQESALKIAQKEGIALIRLNSNNKFKWINYRKEKQRNTLINEQELTDEGLTSEPFVCKIGNKRITNFADLFLELSIIDYFADSKEFIEVPYISDEKINNIVDKLYGYNLYDISSLNIDKTISFLKEKYDVNFIFDTEDNDGYLGKIEFNPLCIKIAKRSRLDDNRWRFTLAHEIGHLILHSKLLKDRLAEMEDDEESLFFNFIQSKSNLDRFELQANLFASTLLLPEKILIPRIATVFKEYRIHKKQLFLDHQPVNRSEVFSILHKLSGEFQISVEALRIRLIKLNLLVDQTDISIRSIIKNMR